MQRKPQKLDSPVDYPDGVMVQTESSYYYIRGGKKFKAYSVRAFRSWGITPIKGSESSLSSIPLAKSPLGFRDGTLIHNVADGRMYLISGNARRHIVSPDVFDRFGWKRRGAIKVSDAETQLHPEGDNLS
jgi:hypothetical protein